MFLLKILSILLDFPWKSSKYIVRSLLPLPELSAWNVLFQALFFNSCLASTKKVWDKNFSPHFSPKPAFFSGFFRPKNEMILYRFPCPINFPRLTSDRRHDILHLIVYVNGKPVNDKENSLPWKRVFLFLAKTPEAWYNNSIHWHRPFIAPSRDISWGQLCPSWSRSFSCWSWHSVV